MSTLKLSVIMPVYNAGDFLADAVNSILCQSMQNFEFIIIDDGSTDNSGEILGSFTDDRIRLVKNGANRGVTFSLNVGLQLARGEYVARMDADDISLPERFEMQLAVLDERPNVALCGSWIEFFGNRSHVLQYPVHSDAIKCYLLVAPPFAHPAVVMRRSVLVAHNLQYDESLRYAQDYDLWLRILQVAAGANVARPLLRYREHMAQVSSFHHDEQSEAANLVKKKLFSLLGMDVSGAELEFHTSFFLGKLTPNFDNLQRVDIWLNKLINATNATKIFDGPALRNLLAAHWLRYVKETTCLGLRSWRYFNGSSLGSSLQI